MIDNRPQRQRIPIGRLKSMPWEYIDIYDGSGKKLSESTTENLVSEDLFNTKHYISGVVTAHFTFPILDGDPGYSRWQTVLYGTNSSIGPQSSGDLIFIEDKTGGIAINGTQFYGNSSYDNQLPPNVDSGYVPHRYHIEVGDTLEIYSGRIVQRINDQLSNNYTVSKSYSKSFLSFENSMTCYTVIPNKRIINRSQTIVDDTYERPVRFETKISTSKLKSIPIIGAPEEGTLVTLTNVRFDKTKRGGGGGNDDFLYLEPGKTYTVIDTTNNSIDFRICHGTEMAKYFTKMSFTKPFNLTGIVAGTDIFGYYELWPRNNYDLGFPKPKVSVDTSQDVIDFITAT